MNFTEIVSRLNGLSCPVFGVSWTPSTPDIQVARRVITFLEDRRVLYNNYAWEEPHHCIESAIEMRKFLTTELGNLKDSSELNAPLKAMRAACRKFLNDMPADDDKRGTRGTWHDHKRYVLESALGELRASFGMSVAALAVQYGIDIEDELATILPPEDVDEDGDAGRFRLLGPG